MSATLISFHFTCPSPSATSLLRHRAPMSLSHAPPSSLLRFESALRPQRVSVVAPLIRPRGLVPGLLPLRHRNCRNPPLYALEASSEESKPLEIEEDLEKSNPELQPEKLQEAWKQSLATFREQALRLQTASEEVRNQYLASFKQAMVKQGVTEEVWNHYLTSFKEQAAKMQSLPQEAEVYSKKALIILKDTSEQLKIQAEQTRQVLSVVAQDIGEEGKVYLSKATENSPEPVRDVVETFASSDIKDIAELRDFYLGIPYGIFLSFGGFLSFMLTGSIPAIRFGVILGGTLLALSISSLRSWKLGNPSSLALKGQAAIASILFLRQMVLLFKGVSISSSLAALLSGAMVGFYLYRIKLGGGQQTEENASSNLGPGN